MRGVFYLFNCCTNDARHAGGSRLEAGGRTGNGFSTANHANDAKKTRLEAVDCRPQAFDPNHKS
jgi:hypothetical protein